MPIGTFPSVCRRGSRPPRRTAPSTRQRRTGGRWVDTLAYLENAGVAELICYVDLCNEFPHWLPVADWDDVPEKSDPIVEEWIAEAVETVRETRPAYNYTISFSPPFDELRSLDVSSLDFLELHLWMEHFAPFLDELGGLDGTDEEEYFDALGAEGGALYDADERRWRQGVRDAILLCPRVVRRDRTAVGDDRIVDCRDG